jgi:hypothetical protein
MTEQQHQSLIGIINRVNIKRNNNNNLLQGTSEKRQVTAQVEIRMRDAELGSGAVRGCFVIGSITNK